MKHLSIRRNALRHMVIGAGNLGLDIFSHLQAMGEIAGIFTLSTGYDVTNLEELARSIAVGYFDVIWYCVGHGGVEMTKQNPGLARMINITVPSVILKAAPEECGVILFSSDHVADPAQPHMPYLRRETPLSEFGRLKLDMERMAMGSGRAYTAIVRVGSLYGTYKPSTTFPGRMIERFGFDYERTIRIPSNLVTPTPTMWVAAMLYQNLAMLLGPRPQTHHCAPVGSLALWDWATFILEGLRDHRDFYHNEYFDSEIPLDSSLGCSFVKTNWHWHDLWETYFRQRWFTPREHLLDLPLDRAALSDPERQA